MYVSQMTVKETQKAIKRVRILFEESLCSKLNLMRVSAPMFVETSSGLNDSLNGVERPVSFDAPGIETGEIEIVHSLAKWKRQALSDYGFDFGEGLYTNMNAIRRDETLDEIHSIYVDQWDFEKIISDYERSVDYLKSQVELIFSAVKEVEEILSEEYPVLKKFLPEKITFLTSEELLQKYPGKTSKEREREAVREYGAVFLIGIGGKLSSGIPHDGRAPDYDDWSLNGDLLFYNPVLDDVLEISSMGIRVNSEVLMSQLKERNQEERLKYPFHKNLMEGKLPLTFGGGIGQSRLCQLLLKKYHIGEVQCSIWPDSMRDDMRQKGVILL